MNEQELLAVLDMDEDFQWNFLIARQDIQEMCQNQLDAWCESKYKRRVLADLAFQLRDEAMREYSDNWALACWYVQQWIGFHKIETYESPDLDGLLNADHEILSKSPIVWIIAALIAKDKEDE